MAGREPERACPGCCTQYRAGACLERRGLPAHLPARCQGPDYAPETDSDLNDLVRWTCLCVWIVGERRAPPAGRHTRTDTHAIREPTGNKPEWPNQVQGAAHGEHSCIT